MLPISYFFEGNKPQCDVQFICKNQETNFNTFSDIHLNVFTIRVMEFEIEKLLDDVIDGEARVSYSINLWSKNNK